MAYVGPMLGQAHQYLFYHKGKSEFAEERSRTYSNNVYEILNAQLSNNNYICNDYSIADIAEPTYLRISKRIGYFINNVPKPRHTKANCNP